MYGTFEILMKQTECLNEFSKKYKKFALKNYSGVECNKLDL